LRTNGSPPVMRNFLTPKPAKTRAVRAISSNVRICSRLIQGYSSSGMQYVQRKLQRSVMEMRKSSSGRFMRSRIGKATAILSTSGGTARSRSAYISSVTTFREEQRFRQPWLMLLMAASTLVAAWAGQTVQSGPAATLSAVALPVAIWVWLLSMTLITEVRPEGLYVRFKMLWPERIIPYYQIVKAEAKTYRPILEYGGWGVRGIAPVKAFNVSSNRGVLLSLTDGQYLMIGSQRPDQLAAALQPGVTRARGA